MFNSSEALSESASVFCGLGNGEIMGVLVSFEFLERSGSEN